MSQDNSFLGLLACIQFQDDYKITSDKSDLKEYYKHFWYFWNPLGNKDLAEYRKMI